MRACIDLRVRLIMVVPNGGGIIRSRALDRNKLVRTRIKWLYVGMRIHESKLRQGELRVKVAVEVKGEEVLVDRLHLHCIGLSVSSETAGRQGSQRSTG